MSNWLNYILHGIRNALELSKAPSKYNSDNGLFLLANFLHVIDLTFVLCDFSPLYDVCSDLP